MSQGGGTARTALIVGGAVCLGICATLAFVFHRGVSAAENYLSGDRTESFTSYTTSLRGMAKMALCSAKRVEVLKLNVPTKLGLSYSELTIIMPVEYAYCVDMKGRWELKAENGILKVAAPELELLAASPDLSGTAVAVDRSVLDFGEAEKRIDSLKTQATARLKARGSRPDAIAEVKETARRELAAVVMAWVANAKYGAVKSVVIRFADEKDYPRIGYSDAANGKL
jgi:hypothetical protein